MNAVIYTQLLASLIANVILSGVAFNLSKLLDYKGLARWFKVLTVLNVAALVVAAWVYR